jgi:RecA-family ATPase
MDVSDLLPFCLVHRIEERQEASWLIESLWLKQAAGIIGGQAKCCKTWLGLDAAVSVASGTPCLGRYAVSEKGSALVYLAEDQVSEVRSRVEGICKSRGIDVETLDLTVITAATLRLDDDQDRKRLWRTIETTKPRLILLDPLVRLHRLDENNSRDIAGILGFLREVQRHFKTAVILTHHSSKRTHARPGQGLRGSSDLHAFGDSNLYLAKSEHDLVLTVEHRSAAAIDKVHLQLAVDGSVHLRLLDQSAAATPGPTTQKLEDKILHHLATEAKPVARQDLRGHLRTNNQRFGQALTTLLASGQIAATPAGIILC